RSRWRREASSFFPPPRECRDFNPRLPSRPAPPARASFFRHPRSAGCRPRSRRSRIAATGTGSRVGRISPPPRCASSARRGGGEIRPTREPVPDHFLAARNKAKGFKPPGTGGVVLEEEAVHRGLEDSLG